MSFSHIVGPFLLSAAFAGLVWLFRFSVRWKKHRSQYRDLPCPPHSFWWGHLKVMGEATGSLPPDAHPHVAFALIKDKYNLDHVFYLDLWPVSDSMMIIHDPGVAAQITQTKNLPKHTLLKKFLRNMTGEHSIVSTEGQEWKTLRHIFSPGFSPQQVVAMIPIMLKHIGIFRDKLLALADTGKIFPMQELASWATFDIIGEVTMGKDLNSQTDPSGLAENFRKSVSWAGSTFNIVRHYVASAFIWYYTDLLDRDIGRSVLERNQGHDGGSKIQKTTVDLALQAYRDERFGTSEKYRTELERDFMTIAINNIKTLLLGGYETTATTLSYTFYLLSTHPEVLERIRDEHESVFSSNDPQTMIASDPQVLNLLHLTTAAVKEALRLYPPGTTLRMCLPSSPIQFATYKDKVLPLANYLLWVNHYSIGRRDDLWPDARSFKPERFLPGVEQPKDAFRSFEKGPRACIGMEMALTEMKIVLVLLLKDLDLEAMYPAGCPRAPEVYGGSHYQMVQFGPKPAMHMPMRAKKRKVAN